MIINNKQNILIAVSGASGSIYASRLIHKLKIAKTNNQIDEIALVFSKNAKEIWKQELKTTEIESTDCKNYNINDFYAPFASGSAVYDTMIICPCSMGTLGRIANGVSNDLITRAADVVLKERKKLIAVVRETPYSIIHINNMQKVTNAGGIICAANPSFYSKPKTIIELVDTVVDRVIDLCGLNQNTFRWSK